MTQGITNTKLNNFEEMLSQTSKVSEVAEYGMDKTAKGFKSVFDKTLDKVQEKVADKEILVKEKVDLAEIKASIKELKDGREGSDSVNSWSEFKDLLAEISNEANVETSLDLTLAKDINEIISQLKEAVENTGEIIEEESGEKVLADVFATLEDVVESEDDLTLELDNETNQEENLNSEQNLPFEQLLSSLNTVLTKPVVEEKRELEFENIEEDDSSLKMELNLDLSDMEQGEIINLSENLSDDVVSLKSMQSTETSDSEFQIDEDLLKELNIESVKAEVDTSTGENLMQNQAPEEYAVKAMINEDVEVFDVKIESTLQVNQAPQQVQAKPVDVNPSRIIDQITKHLEGLQNNSKISIVLNPESLGKVDIQLLTTKEGLSAQFTVATQEARDLLMKGLESLKETLMSQGVGVDNVSVKVAEGQKSEYKQDWTEQEGSRGGNKGQDQPNKEEKEKGLFEKMMAKNNEEENGNV